jgi:hypothetical protein
MAPYSYTGSSLSPGAYNITVRAVDTSGIGGVSSTYIGITSSTHFSDVDGQPMSYQLKENFPNPFNPITTISYLIPEGKLVRLEIFNVSGQKVRELVNSFEPAGRHSITWNGLDQYGKVVSSGVYHYRLSAGSYVKTKKMILLR